MSLDLDMIGRKLGKIRESILNTPFVNNFNFFQESKRKKANELLEQIVDQVEHEYQSLGDNVVRNSDDPITTDLAKVKKIIKTATGSNSNFEGPIELYREQILGIAAGNYGFSAQLSTGEGKTITAVAYALSKKRKEISDGMYGYVDIHCSNRKLAERDFRENKEVYENAGLSVGVNIERGAVYDDLEGIDKEIFKKYSIDSDNDLFKLLRKINGEVGYVEELKLIEHLDDLKDNIGENKKYALSDQSLLFNSVVDLIDERVLRHKQEAYRKDVLYTTIPERIFDIIQDNNSVLKEKDQIQVKRRIEHAVVDEADQNMVDEAISPKLSSSGVHKDNHYFKRMMVEFHEKILNDNFYDMDHKDTYKFLGVDMKKVKGKVVEFHEKILNNNFYGMDHKDIFKFFGVDMKKVLGIDFIVDNVTGLGVLGEPYLNRYFGPVDLLSFYDKSGAIKEQGAKHIADKIINSTVADEIFDRYGCVLDRGNTAGFSKVLYKALRQKPRQLKKDVKYVVSNKDIKKIFIDYEDIDKAKQALDDISYFVNVLNKAKAEHTMAGLGAVEKATYFEKEDGTLGLIDEVTGFESKGMVLSSGLHTALDVLAGNYKVDKGMGAVNDLSKLTDIDLNSAEITNTHFFSKYKSVFWTTGTLKDISFVGEENYDLPSLMIDTHYAKDPRATYECAKDKIFEFETIEEKYESMIDHIVSAHEKNLPVLYRVINREEGLILSELVVNEIENRMKDAGKDKGYIADEIKKIREENIQILSHENEQDYEGIISKAGQKDMINFVTDMGGRGANIKLDKDVKYSRLLKLLNEYDDGISLVDSTLTVANEKLAEELKQYLISHDSGFKDCNIEVEKGLANHKVKVEGMTIDKIIDGELFSSEIQGMEGGLTSLSADKRNDEQAVGRVARNGDPGTMRMYLSAEDPVYGMMKGKGMEILVDYMNYKGKSSKNQMIFSNRDMNIESVIDNIYSKRQDIVEKEADEIKALKTLEDLKSYISDHVNKDDMLIEGLKQMDIDRFKDKKDFDNIFDIVLSSSLENSFDEKQSIDDNLNDIYHKKKWAGRKAWDFFATNYWWIFPAGYLAFDVHSGLGAGRMAFNAARNITWFGGFKLYEKLQNMGVNKPKPVGREKSYREPSGVSKMASHGMQNWIYYFAGAGIGASLIAGAGLASSLLTISPALGFFAINRWGYFGSGWQAGDKKSTKKLYNELTEKAFADNIKKSFSQAGDIKENGVGKERVSKFYDEYIKGFNDNPRQAFMDSLDTYLDKTLDSSVQVNDVHVPIRKLVEQPEKYLNGYSDEEKKNMIGSAVAEEIDRKTGKKIYSRIMDSLHFMEPKKLDVKDELKEYNRAYQNGYLLGALRDDAVKVCENIFGKKSDTEKEENDMRNMNIVKNSIGNSMSDLCDVVFGQNDGFDNFIIEKVAISTKLLADGKYKGINYFEKEKFIDDIRYETVSNIMKGINV